MKTHELKTDERHFDAVLRLNKKFEIRFNDRDFRVGDKLHLRETRFTGEEMKSGKPLEYTGREALVLVVHILSGPIYGLEAGWIVMSIEFTDTHGVNFAHYKGPFGVDCGTENGDPIEIRDSTGKLVLSGVPSAAAHAFVRALNGHTSTEDLLNTYRAAWYRLPDTIQRSTLATMRTWSPMHQRRIEDDVDALGADYGRL